MHAKRIEQIKSGRRKPETFREWMTLCRVLKEPDPYVLRWYDESEYGAAAALGRPRLG